MPTTRWLEKLQHRLRALFFRSDADYELNDELRFHIDQKTQLYIDRGLSRAEARRQAILEFRGVERLKEECRDARGWRWLEDFTSDVAFSLRQLRKTPGFTTVAILTLALGIGANAAIYTLVHAFLLKNLPVADPKTLVRVGDHNDCCLMSGIPRDSDYSLFPTEVYTRLRKDVPEFADLAAMEAGYPYNPVIARRANTQQQAKSLTSEFVSGNYFRTFGLTPEAGRFFHDDDDVKGAPITAVMSYALWQSAYGGDASIVGSTFWIDTQPVTIVGIAPQGFYGDRLSATPPEIYLPIQAMTTMRTAPYVDDVNMEWLYLIGRVQLGTNLAELQAKVSTITKQTMGETKHFQDPRFKQDTDRAHVTLSPGGAGVQGLQDQYKSNLQMLMIASGLVLLIACANIANLLLVRGMQRKAELSVRTALGAARSRLVRQLLTESVLLAGLGGLAGLALAYGGTRLLLSLAFPDAVNLPISPSPSPEVIGFAVVLSLVTGILFGIAPAWMAARTDPADALRGARTTASGASPLQRTLVVVQAALAVILLASAGLFLESLGNLEGTNLHVDAKNRYIIHMSPPDAGYATTSLAPLYREIEDRFHAIPGVKYVGISSYTPMEDSNWGTDVQIAGKADIQYDGVSTLRVSPEYFDSVGTHVVQGRSIGPQDVPGAPTAAVVNQAFVRKFFAPGENPIGQHFGAPEDPQSLNDNEIVGVVDDTVYSSLRWKDHAMFFSSFAQEPASRKDPIETDLSLYAHTIVLATEAPMPDIEAVSRKTLSGINANLAVMRFETFSRQIASQTSQDRMIARLTMVFGGLSLLLAAIGLYGVTAYTVARRTSEIGIRIALGARPAQVVSMVMRGAMVQTLIGLAIGIPVVAACTKYIESQLFDVKGMDWRVVVVAVVALGAASALAGLIPARRASAIDPARTLTME
jgi:macrolide transport system ATP-binding/permease protein